VKKILLLCLLLPIVPLSAQTLVSITVLPSADGYHLANTSSSAQLGTLCTYSDNSTDNCSTQTLTWGSSDPADLTVGSTGLASFGTSQGGSIASIVRTSNVVTVTTTAANSIAQFSTVIITGVTDSSFNGTFVVQNINSSTAFTYNETAANSTSSGGQAFISSSVPEAYVTAGTVLGHHKVKLDPSVITSLASRPETADSTLVLGTTALLSAEDSTTDTVGGAAEGDYCAWVSSDPSVVSVTNVGRITGVSVGSATITCNLAGVHVDRTMTVVNPTPALNTYYVRADGGTRFDANVPTGQCDGLSDQPYPGSGTDQPCAFNSPMYLLTDDTSTTVYTGALQAGDTGIIDPAPTPYLMNGKSSSTSWKKFGPIPSGTPAHPTRILGSNYASCTTPSALELYFNGTMFDVRDSENVDIECIDFSTNADCNGGLIGGLDFTCPNNVKPFAFLSDSLTANFHLNHVSIHGYFNAWTGTPGAGLVIANSTIQGNYLDGLNFDDPSGYNGNRSDGFEADYDDISYNGCSTEVPKQLTSASRDGAGNLTVTFVANQMVNYTTATNLVLTGMTPADMNGTFPVSAVTFNQNTATITGGSCVKSANSPYVCTFTTSAQPTFGQGEFVNIAGESPTWLNGTFEVYSSSATGFVINASPVTRPGWSATTISSGGSASTAVTVIATAGGGAESASVVGTASHVHPYHRCFDQNDGGFSNGDGVGTGNNTIGTWKCDHCTLANNLQDGWDMLHSAMDLSNFTNSFSYGNEGAQAKFGNTDVGNFTDNLLMGSCAVLLAPNPDMPPDYNQYLATPCRAADTLPFGDRAWSKMTVSNNTIDGAQDTIIDDSCQDAIGCNALPSFSQFVMQNNIFMGFTDTNNPTYNSSLPAVYFGSGSYVHAPWGWVNNMGYNSRNGPSGTNNQWTTNPLTILKVPNIASFAAESNALTFNFNLNSDSPAIGAGVHNSFVPTTDHVNYPMSNPPVIGALMFQSGPVSPATFSGHIYLGGNVVIK